jgi:hypothetical protein
MGSPSPRIRPQNARAHTTKVEGILVHKLETRLTPGEKRSCTAFVRRTTSMQDGRAEALRAIDKTCDYLSDRRRTRLRRRVTLQQPGHRAEVPLEQSRE